MPEVSLTCAYHQTLASRPRQARQRFRRYCEDLYAAESQTLDLNSINLGGYSYAELGDIALQHCQQHGLLTELDLLVISFWGHEFDPSDTYGAFLLDKYELQTNAFDVCEQGTLAPFTGIKLIINEIRQNQASRALLVAFDQGSDPVAKDTHVAKPKRSDIGVFAFAKADVHNSNSVIIDSGVASEESVLAMILQLDLAQTLLLSHQNNPITRKLSPKQLTQFKGVHYVDQHNNCMDCLALFTDVLADSSCHKPNDYFLVLQADEESDALGYLLGTI